MAMAIRMTSLGGGQYGISREGWWHRDVKGSEIISFRNMENRKSCAQQVRMNFGVVTYATAAAPFGVGADGGYGVDHVKNGKDGMEEMIVEELDHLLQNSIVEIVKNVSNAPLLVHVYTENGPKSSPSPSSLSSNNTKLVIEKATSETWPLTKQRWENSCHTIPNGIILVEELDSKDNKTTSQEDCLDQTCSLECATSNASNSSNKQLMESSPATRLWGVLVQGRGVNVPACYLLKTCQVQCCFGFSTHFCLAKVDCFGQSVDFHLSKLWLQR